MLDIRKMKRIRVRNKQTQLDVAIRADMRPEVISKIETGQRDDIRLSTLDRLAKAMKVKPAELVK